MLTRNDVCDVVNYLVSNEVVIRNMLHEAKNHAELISDYGRIYEIDTELNKLDNVFVKAKRIQEMLEFAT